MTTQDQYANRLIVDGRDCGIFDTWDGGAGDSSETKYYEGGTGRQRTLGGRPMLDNFTVGRLYDLDRGDHELVRWLHTRRGKGKAVGIRQPLDLDGRPFGDPFIYNGILKKVTPGKTDSNATAADVFTVEVSTGGDLG